MDNKAIRLEARRLLEGKWGKLVRVWLILYAIYIIISTLSHWGSLITLILSGPLMLGIYKIFLKLWYEEDF